MTEAVLQQAREHLQAGRQQQADELLDALLAEKSTDSQWLLKLGDVLTVASRNADAERCYRAAIDVGAPAPLAYPKLQRVVVRQVRAAEDGGHFMRPAGDGRAVPPTREHMLAEMARINQEIEKSPEVMPSKFWQVHARQHVDLLLRHGLENFKRTVAHNYYNWLTLSMADGQIRRLLDLWSLHGSMEVFSDQMEAPGAAGMPVGGNQESYALLNEDAQKVYKLGVSLLWDYTLLTDRHGILRQLEEPLTGNPLRISRRGRLLSQDLAHSVRERNTILDCIDTGPTSAQPLVIGELGAGHGRLAHVFHMTRNCRYLIFDIAPALMVSQWYISSLFPDEPVFHFRPFDSFDEVAEEVGRARFAFFSANQIEVLPPGYCDLFINVCSLMEMRVETIQHYFDQIERVTRGHFYTKQWYVQNNREDGIVYAKDDYPVPARWRCLLDQKDPINPRLFEQLWQVS